METLYSPLSLAHLQSQYRQARPTYPNPATKADGQPHQAHDFLAHSNLRPPLFSLLLI